MRRILLVLAACLCMMPAGYAQRRDSVYTASERFQWQKLVVPVTLMGAGTIAAYSPCWKSGVDQPAKAWAAQIRGDKYIGIDDYVQFVPAAGYAVAAICGAGEHGFWEQLMTGATAYILMFGTVQAVKYATAMQRPNGRGNTFPSGHTATAFMGAELVRLEYGPWWGLAAYAAAVPVAFLRVYNEWHWVSDLIAGAGLGILCANAAYWLMPFERKLFGVDSAVPSRQGAPALSAVPFCAPAPSGTCYGLSLTMAF
ncbi:MAG: phosphatase PAP2 family protein [Bacteroidales bacterium]|nr:phosphatase PAP2 family protein [Bacteroidales bacterium]